MKPANAWAAIVAAAGVTAVLLGAFGAHALSGRVDAQAMSIWNTAVDYQFWHALALALAAFAVPSGRARDVALRAFGLGIVLFSGSLYALALGAPYWIGAITPLGGVAFIVGWVALGLSLRSRAQH